MRVLILSVSAGGGHINAAEAIESHIKSNIPKSSIKIVDAYKAVNPVLDKVVIGSYLKSLKYSPSIFGKLYKLAEKDDGLAYFTGKLNMMVIHKLLPVINDFEPDIIISTHAFCTEMISMLKGMNKINIPLVTILTDYATHSFWIHPNVDAYIVSTENMAKEMYERGVGKDFVYPFGIPVKPQFNTYYPKTQTLRSLELSEYLPTVLLMGGSLGMGGIYSLYQQLIQIKTDLQIIIITGKNKKLFNKLQELSKETDKPTRIIGYTSEVNKYMQASDLLITKPGGLTITEALISNIPMAIFSAIQGPEEQNAEFLIKNNLGVILDDIKNCSAQIEKLISSKTTLNKMKSNCKVFAKPNSGTKICELLEKLVKDT